jgi:glucosylceramidase
VSLSAFLTAPTGKPLSPLLLGEAGQLGDGLPSVWMNPAIQFQVIEGFGGAFTEAAAVTWQRLSVDKQEQALRACFDPHEGLGYRLCRVHMNSCDFALGNYSHLETAGDTLLQGFSIERDRRALLPMIKAAQRIAGEPIKLLASPWSPPAWMKSNGHMNNGGRLLPQFRAIWAQCFVRFIYAYANEGVPIWGVTVQNEPEAMQRWDSCLYTAEEERDFVRDHLGPALADAGLGHVKIIIWDHNRDRMVERASVVYADPDAARHVWGTGFHWYVEDHFDHVQLTHDAWPNKHLLFTEGCQEGGPHLDEWAVGERYARSMIQDLNHWTEGWIDWNLMLDTSGGPNHVGNFCSAPLLVDTQRDALLLQSSFHYIGHFARFIHPGARRALCTSSREALEVCGIVNPDGGQVLVTMNRTTQPQAFRLSMGRLQADAELPAHSIATFLASGQ